MGSGSSAEKNSKEISPVYVPDSVDSYPPPNPPTTKKSEVFRDADYAHIDNHAKSAPSSVCSDYSSLLDYLFEDLKSDMQMLRAIFSWLGSQNIEDKRLGNVTDSNSPAGYMRLIQKQQGSYAAFFTLLCRAAKIPCVIVRGKGKAVGYEVGEQDVSRFNSKWTAVYVGSQWRLIHPLWAFSGVKGQKSGKWTMIEKKGEGQREREHETKGSDIRTNEDFFFLTDPDQFVYFCRANEEPWQLLSDPMSEEKFVNGPFFTPEYFSSGLKLTSDQTCSLIAHQGKEAVRFEHSKDKNPSLSYELYCDEEESDETLPDSVDLERYVLENTQKTTKALFLRFPVSGVYKLRVFGGEGQRPPHICDFRIRCDEEAKNPNPFPLQKDIGYGYGHEAKEAGLVTASAYSGIVVLEHGQKMSFNFDVDRPVEFETKLHHRDKTNEDLEKYVEKNVTNKNAEITVTMPEEGLTKDSEYALEINTKEEDTNEPFKNVCNYFLTPDKREWKADSDAQPNNKAIVRPVGRQNQNRTQNKVQQKPRQKPQSPVRSESPRYRMRDATKGESIEELERTVREFEKSDLDEKNEDLTKAKERLVQLRNGANKDETPRERMRDATKEDSIEDLEKAIGDFENTDLDEKDRDLTKAKQRLAELKKKKEEEDAIRERMRDATKEDSIEDLEKAIGDFENTDLDEKDRDLTKAKQRLAELKKKKEEEDAIRERMRDATNEDSIEDLEKAIRDFENADLDEKNEDLTRAKERLAKLKNDAYQEPDTQDESAREAMRDATDYASPEELEKAIKDFEDSGLDEKDDDLTKAKEKLAQMKQNKRNNEDDEKLRENLAKALGDDDMEALDKALEDCKEAGVSDKGDIADAEKKLLDMHKEKLEEARRTRDAEKIQKALEEAEQSAVANKLDDTEDYQGAKQTNEQLARVRKFNKQVLELNPRLVSEIASYKRPKPCIQDVMKATYIVLGEKEQDTGWRSIVKQMKCVGQKNIIRRVGQFDIVGVEPDRAKEADKLISKYDLNDVQRNSRGAGTFYSWTRNVIDEVLKGDNEE